MSDREPFPCQGPVFTSQYAARLAVGLAKAAVDRAIDLQVYICHQGHFHYREQVRL